MISTWFDTLDPNRRTLTVALILVCLATLPFYGVGLWRLRAQDHGSASVQAQALDPTDSEETDVPTPDVSPPTATVQSSEPALAPVAPIRQSAPPQVAPPAPPAAAKPAPARAPEPAGRGRASEHGHGDKDKKH